MSELTPNIFIKSYWNYYLELEEQFITTKKFAEFDISNYSTYSIEYLKLFQAVCSEIDVVAKVLSEENYPDFRNIKKKNIQKWGYYLQLSYPNLENSSIIFNGDYKIQPWSNWKYEKYINKQGHLSYKLSSGKKTPFWWIAYNKVKHERTTYSKNNKINYSQANQKNLIYSLSALFILETFYLDSVENTINCPYMKSKLFKYIQQ